MEGEFAELGVEEMTKFRQQLASEVSALTNNMMTLQRTAGRFAAAGQTVEHLTEQKEGVQMLLPLTESLYVPGRLKRVDSVILEIGTGYYIEKTAENSVDYFRRKVLTVKDKVEELAKLVQARKMALKQADQAIAGKLGSS